MSEFTFERQILQRTQSIYNRQLLLAASNGNLEELRRLSDSGADLSFRDEHRNTVLHYAVTSRNIELVQFLLYKLVNVSLENDDNKTPLMIAQSMQENSDVVERIREKIRQEVEDARGDCFSTIVNLDELENEMIGMTQTGSFLVNTEHNENVAIFLDFFMKDTIIVYYTNAILNSKLGEVNLEKPLEFKKINGWENPAENVKSIKHNLEYLRTIPFEEINLKSLHLYPKLINSVQNDFKTKAFTYRNANTFMMMLEMYKHDDLFQEMRTLIYNTVGQLNPEDFSLFLNNGDTNQFFNKLQRMRLSDIKASLADPFGIELVLPAINVESLFKDLLGDVNSNWERIIYEMNVNIVPILYEENSEEIDVIRRNLLFKPRDEYFKNTLLGLLSRLFKYYFAGETYNTLQRVNVTTEDKLRELYNQLNLFINTNIDQTYTIPVNNTEELLDTNISNKVELYLKFMMITELCHNEECADLCRKEMFKKFQTLQLISKKDLYYNTMKNNLRLKLVEKNPRLGVYYDEIIKYYAEEERELPVEIKKYINDFSNGIRMLMKISSVTRIINVYENYLYEVTNRHNDSFTEKVLNEIPKVGQIVFPFNCGQIKVNFCDLLVNMFTLFFTPSEKRNLVFQNAHEMYNDKVFLKYLMRFDDFENDEFILKLIKEFIKIKEAASFVIALLLKVDSDRVINYDLTSLISTLEDDHYITNIVELLKIDHNRINILERLYYNRIFNKIDLSHVLTEQDDVERFYIKLEKINDRKIVVYISNLLNKVSECFSDRYLFHNILILLNNERAQSIRNRFFEATDSIVLTAQLYIAYAYYRIGKEKNGSGIRQQINDTYFHPAQKILRDIIEHSDIEKTPHIHISCQNVLLEISFKLKDFQYITPMQLYYIHQKYAFGAPRASNDINIIDLNQIKADYFKIKNMNRYKDLLNKWINIKCNDLLYILCNEAFRRIVMGISKNDEKFIKKNEIIMDILNTVYFLRKRSDLSRESDVRMDMNKLARTHHAYANNLEDTEMRRNHYFIALEYYMNIYKLQKERFTNIDYTFKYFIDNTERILDALNSLDNQI